MDCSGKDNFVPHAMHIAYAPDGLGTYSAEALGYYKTSIQAIPLVLEAIKASDIKTDSGFTIVDYGTADGGTSMPLMYESVKAIREKYGEQMPITIIYEDQPVNDFKSVFMRLQGFIPGPRSYLMDFNNVFVMACGTNFYSQCVPSNTVNLGFSACCVHWLREKTCIEGLLTPEVLTDENEEKKFFSKQAEKDWESFLLNRAEELAPGGYMVQAQSVRDDKDQFFGQTKLTKVSLHELICSLWLEFVKEGKITQEEFKNTNYVEYIRTVEEFKKPFNDANSPVRKKGLELVTLETHVKPCPHKERWMKEKGDAEQHAKRLISCIQIWLSAALISGLSDSRSAEEKSKIVDEFYHRYESLVAKNPEDHGVDFVIAFIVIRKRL